MHGKGFFDRILVRAGKRGIDQLAHIRVARMHRQLVAVLDHAADVVDLRKIELRRHALRVEIERDVDDIDIAGALAIAKQAAFHPLRARHQGQLGSRYARTPVVVRMHRQHDGIAARQIAVHPLDHVGKHIRRGMLHRGRQVDDAGPRGRGLPDGGDGIDHAPGKCQLGARKMFRRILKRPLRGELLRGQITDQGGVRAGQIDNLIFIHAQHHAAHHRRSGVVQMHDGAACARQSLHGAANQRLFGGRHDLNRHVVRHQLVLDEVAQKIEFDLRSSRKTDFDLLEADVQQMLKHAQFSRHVHRFNQRLIAVAQVGAEPDWRVLQHGVGPGAVGQSDGWKRRVFVSGLLQHGDFSEN